MAAAARKPPESPGRYNLKAGPVYFDLTGSVGVDFNDNVYLSDALRESDWVFRPALNLRGFWQVTRLNALRVDIGLGLAKYLHHHDLDSSALLVAPDSVVSFDVFVGNLRINFHDRFSITQNPVDEALLSGVGRFDRLQNAAGVSFLWDWNDLKLLAGYDHYNFWSLQDEFETLDRSEEQFTASVALRLSDALETGFDASASLIDYDRNFQNDGWSASVGPFVEMQVSRYLKFRASAGYQMMSFDGGGQNGDSNDLHGWFANLSLAHQLNSRMTQTIMAGHESRLGLVTNFAEVSFARYMFVWRMNSRWTVTLDGLFEDSQESAGDLGAEDSQRVSAGVGVQYAVNSRLSVGVRYRFSAKDSNLHLRDYYQNVVSFDANYDL